MSYIGKLQIDSMAAIPIGSSLFGICQTSASSAAKVATLSNFDKLISGVTVHIKFVYGNNISASSSFSLQVGSTESIPISNPGGSTNWAPGAVISFTYDDSGTPPVWIVNDSDSGANITIEQTYDSSSQVAISGRGVADALDTLGDAASKDIVTNIVDNGNNSNNTNDTIPTTGAVAAYVNAKTFGFTDAMRFVGITTTLIADNLNNSMIAIDGDNYSATTGNVVLTQNHQEYIWSGSKWELLGDEEAYALKSRTANVVHSVTFTANTLPQLTVTSVSVPIITNAGSAPSLTTASVSIPNITDIGSAATFEVTNGVLSINRGTAPTLGTNITIQEVNHWDAGSAPTMGTPINIGSASDWNAGTQATLSSDNQAVVIP